MKQSVEITAVHLVNTGHHTIVRVETGGVWFDVIKELSDGSFSHIIEGRGIHGIVGLRSELGETRADDCLSDYSETSEFIK